MFSQNVSLKNKQNFQKNGCKDSFFTFNVEIKSNHNIEQFILTHIEDYLNKLEISQYNKIQKEKK